MSDVRLTATNPEDSTLVPVACNSRGELMIVEPVIEKISNDLDVVGNTTVTGNLTVTGDYIGLPEVEGLPTPLGEEGMVLSIMDGKPTWVFFEPPEPPPPEYDITLADQRGTVLYENATFSMRNDDGQAVDPDDDWNTYIRTLATWETQADGKYGLALDRGGNPRLITFEMPFQLDLKGGFGKVLQIQARMAFSQPSADWGRANFELTTTETQLTPINNKVDVNLQTGWVAATFQYLVSRDDLGVVDLSLLGTVPSGYNHTINTLSLQRFEYIDSFRVLQQLLLSQQDLGPAEPR